MDGAEEVSATSSRGIRTLMKWEGCWELTDMKDSSYLSFWAVATQAGNCAFRKTCFCPSHKKITSRKCCFSSPTAKALSVLMGSSEFGAVTRNTPTSEFIDDQLWIWSHPHSLFCTLRLEKLDSLSIKRSSCNASPPNGDHPSILPTYVPLKR